MNKQEQNNMKKFKIKTNHFVFIDDFEQGEKQCVNSYELSIEINSDNYTEAIKYYFENYLSFEFNIKFSYIDKDSNSLNYSVLVDSDNNEVKDGDYMFSEWKKGKQTLYNNHIDLYVYELKEITLQ